jgi:hypothetical protein
MDIAPRKFLVTWVVAFVVALAALAAFNVAVDPYLLFDTPRISGFNAQKSEDVYRHELMIKVYDAPRRVPKTLVLGSSVVDLGLDSLDPAWPELARPVYNLGFIGGGDPRLGYLYLQYILSRQDLSLIVLGLDFQLFLKSDAKDSARFNDPSVEARLAIDHQGIRVRQQLLDALQASISMDATRNSLSTVAASIEKHGANFIGGNIPVMSIPPVSVTGFYMGVLYRRARMDSKDMTYVRAILDLCKSRGIDVIVIINPMHSDVLEVFDRLGLWSAFENWKRELVTLSSERDGPPRRVGVKIWDFTGYDSNTIGIGVLDRSWEKQRLWLDGIHYDKPLGSLILRRIFANEKMEFGATLDRTNVEDHMLAIRQAREVYRKAHPGAAQRVLDMIEDSRQYRWE